MYLFTAIGRDTLSSPLMNSIHTHFGNWGTKNTLRFICNSFKVTVRAFSSLKVTLSPKKLSSIKEYCEFGSGLHRVQRKRNGH